LSNYPIFPFFSPPPLSGKAPILKLIHRKCFTII